MVTLSRNKGSVWGHLGRPEKQQPFQGLRYMEAEKGNVRYKCLPGGRWRTMSMFLNGRTVGEVVREYNESEKAMPLHNKCLWEKG